MQNPIDGVTLTSGPTTSGLVTFDVSCQIMKLFYEITNVVKVGPAGLRCAPRQNFVDSRSRERILLSRSSLSQVSEKQLAPTQYECRQIISWRACQQGWSPILGFRLLCRVDFMERIDQQENKIRNVDCNLFSPIGCAFHEADSTQKAKNREFLIFVKKKPSPDSHIHRHKHHAWKYSQDTRKYYV